MSVIPLNWFSIASDWSIGFGAKDSTIGFEEGDPDWSKCCAGNLEAYPSVKWKLQNICTLKKKNPEKHKDGVDKLRRHFGL